MFQIIIQLTPSLSPLVLSSLGKGCEVWPQGAGGPLHREAPPERGKQLDLMEQSLLICKFVEYPLWRGDKLKKTLEISVVFYQG